MILGAAALGKDPLIEAVDQPPAKPLMAVSRRACDHRARADRGNPSGSLAAEALALGPRDHVGREQQVLSRPRPLTLEQVGEPPGGRVDAVNEDRIRLQRPEAQVDLPRTGRGGEHHDGEAAEQLIGERADTTQSVGEEIEIEAGNPGVRRQAPPTRSRLGRPG